MRDFSTPVRAYILGIALAALALFASGANLGGLDVISEQPLLAGLLVAAIAASSSFPVHMPPKSKITTETTAIFATLLLFPPPAAMAIAALGKFISYQIFLRNKWGHTLFEVAQTMLYTGLGGFTFHNLISEPLTSVINAPSGLLTLVGVALILHAANAFLVAGVVALQTQRSIIRVWVTYNSHDLPQHAALYVMGPLAALVAQISAWALCLMVIPVALIYISFRNNSLLRFQTKEAVEALADTIDMRDPYTFQHSQRVARYARELAVKMGLSEDMVDTIESAARVHDLGKVGIDTSVLSKPAALSESDWEKMRKHPEIGASIVGRFPFFRSGQELILHHHERYDGQGYPNGVNNSSIPIGAKIIAVADAFDAMTSDRPYRRALPLTTVLRELERYKGIQWDPQVTEALTGIIRQDLEGQRASVLLPALALA
ncbi:MAG: HD-GYP domain-containing protein [Anaerolineales bacterium]|nr:HD-GYP domain-containing protein [Anaerolineales bacterium]